MSKQYCTWNFKKNETRLNNIQKSHAMFDRTNLRGCAGGTYCPCPRLPPAGPYDGPSQRQKHIHNWNITPQTKEQTNLWFIRNDWKTQSMEWQPIFWNQLHGIPSKTFICGFIRRISEDWKRLDCYTVGLSVNKYYIYS